MVLTENGPIEVDVPRDRDASFEPIVVPKRLGGVNAMVCWLSAEG